MHLPQVTSHRHLLSALKKNQVLFLLILCSSLISFLESSLYRVQWLQSECVGQLCSESAATYTILPSLIFWVSSVSCWKSHISIFLNSSLSWNTFSSQYLTNNLRNDFWYIVWKYIFIVILQHVMMLRVLKRDYFFPSHLMVMLYCLLSVLPLRKLRPIWFPNTEVFLSIFAISFWILYSKILVIALMWIFLHPLCWAPNLSLLKTGSFGSEML